MKKNLIIFIACAASVIAIDQLTKAVITEKLFMYGTHKVIDGFFNLVYVMNPGAAFGFLSRTPELFRYSFFIGITVLAMLLIIYYLVKSENEKAIITLSLALIFGGAVGNLIDRIRFGAVVDFLDFYIGNWHWPAFNAADSAITVGAALMLWEMIIARHKKPKTS
ncbi:MAG: signal peptidase II [Smithellaceae bacterium]|nr:lipoprotein signal peptidase [Syntrophaceae bacterium]MBP8608550.1 lipoprotein signal peptidase [Syntrophaceae bacterium]MDX9815693.1 signal peptidase II [Smithellaceae bacterium]NMD05520.1 lipoprotein signal peptidase [Deltaproteobacteria bacterium]HOD30563.1 signal peptidase II [Smithellaceae bacterium]